MRSKIDPEDSEAWPGQQQVHPDSSQRSWSRSTSGRKIAQTALGRSGGKERGGHAPKVGRQRGASLSPAWRRSLWSVQCPPSQNQAPVQAAAPVLLPKPVLVAARTTWRSSSVWNAAAESTSWRCPGCTAA